MLISIFILYNLQERRNALLTHLFKKHLRSLMKNKLFEEIKAKSKNLNFGGSKNVINTCSRSGFGDVENESRRCGCVDGKIICAIECIELSLFRAVQKTRRPNAKTKSRLSECFSFTFFFFERKHIRRFLKVKI